MLISERTGGDLRRLRLLARQEKRAEQKDRLMAAALAIEKRETEDIQKALGRSRGFVQRWAYTYRDGGIEALTGVSVALQAPLVNTGTMSVFLKMLSGELEPTDHAVLIMDQAGWHKSRALAVPENISVLLLPPYSPELNPVERLWAYMRSHYLANRVFDDYTHLLDAGAEAWQKLTPELLRSVCSCPYLSHEMEA